MSRRSSGRLVALLTALSIFAISSCALSSVAGAYEGPIWDVHSLGESSASEGDTLLIRPQYHNIGVGEFDGAVSPIRFSGTIPSGFVLKKLEPLFGSDFACTTSSQSFECTSSTYRVGSDNQPYQLELEVQPGTVGPHTIEYKIEGGAVGNPSAESAETVTIGPEPPSFGITDFDMWPSADPSGAPFDQAGGHPYDFTIGASFATEYEPGLGTEVQFPGLKEMGWPVEPLKDAFSDFPPGFVADPTVAPTCTMSQLAKMAGEASVTTRVECAPESQVGTIAVHAYIGQLTDVTVPLYNLVAPPDQPARLGLNFFGTTVVIDANVRPANDYRITSGFRNVSQGLGIVGSTIKLWGTPASPDHDSQRSCANVLNYGERCPSTDEELAFVRNPTHCTPDGEGLPATLRADSYWHQGDFDEVSIETHGPKHFTFPQSQWGEAQGPTGCEDVPFEPEISVQPTIQRADSPTGLSVKISLPQSDEPAALATSDLRKAVIRFPQGMTLNPSSADGLGSCSEAQIRLELEGPAECPPDAKIGSVEIQTPVLADPLQGSVYLATQEQNKFGSLVAIYLVVEGHGVILKLAGEIALQPNGQIVATFDDQPQLPFEQLSVDFFSGPRAVLRTPPACGSYATDATLSPWSGNPASQLTNQFSITSGPEGGACPNGKLNPTLSAGTVNPLAASYSPLQLRVARPDASENLTGISLALPPGLIGRTAGIPYCPDSALAAISAAKGSAAAELAAPHCPAATQIGTATVGAGAGATPFFLKSGKVFFAGPYKGAPISIAVVAPTLAGPFDLGTVVVRNALRIDPDTARVTVVSDPIPTSLYGIPLDLRDIRITANRPDFTLNPTSCDAMAFEAAITGASGATADRSDRFQLAGCDRIGFKPKLSLAFKGKVHRRAHPRLIANLTARPGDANIASAQVKLPAAAFLDNGHIGGVCTRVQFAARSCPSNSIYGKASATSPLLDYTVAGPVYLRSSSHKLPDLVADLRGPDTQPIEVALAGKTDSVEGALRNTFEAVPDVPVTKFGLELFGGKRGLIELSSGLCARPNATILFDGQNGKTYDTSPAVKADCGHKKRGKHRRHRGF